MTRGDAGDLYDAARSLKRTARLDLYELVILSRLLSVLLEQDDITSASNARLPLPSLCLAPR